MTSLTDDYDDDVIDNDITENDISFVDLIAVYGGSHKEGCMKATIKLLQNSHH